MNTTAPFSLFSIDVEAHLSKAASHTFGSAAHYPVELIRAALMRGAFRVDVQINKTHIRVLDDGVGLTQLTLDKLTQLLDTTTPVAQKEEAVEWLQTPEGLGVLALFAPAPIALCIETVVAGSQEKKTLLHNGIHFSSHNQATLQRGTCFTVQAKHRDWNQEKKLVEAFCRTVPATLDIRLNQQPLGGQPVLAHQLAIMDVIAVPPCNGGQVGIPKTGSLCHLRLLNQGIPWRHLNLPPQQGFIFDAAIEYTGDPNTISKVFVQHLVSFAERLYEWLCRSYPKAPDYLKTRIEELIFTHFYQTRKLTYLQQLAPFRFYHSPLATCYADLKAKAAIGKIYAVPQKKDHMVYNTHMGPDSWILSLTREQADLLINHLHIPITFLSPQKPRFFAALLRQLRHKLKKLFLFCCSFPGKVVSGDFLSSEEAFFIRTLNHYLGTLQLSQRGETVQAVLVDSRFPFPILRIHMASNAGGANQLLYLVRRHHKLVRRAVTAVRVDRENIELFIPLLTELE